jgi:vitamin B12 transporter
MKRKNFSTSTKRIVYCLVFMCLCAPLCVFAEETAAHSKEEKTISKMDEMVVTATRVEEPQKDVPASVQIISAEDIKNSPAKDAGELVAEASLGHVQKYNGALTGMVEIRGLQTDLYSPLSSRVLVLINGSNAGTVNLSKIPRDDIERIEIVKGPGSVLYGSSAMGGVINIITKEGKGDFHGSVFGQGGSWDYWKAGAELGGKKERFDYYVTASSSAQGDYHTPGLGTYDNTAYKDETASARFGYTLFNDHHVSFGYQHWRGWDIGSPGGTYALDPDDYSNKKRDSFDVNYKTGTFGAKYYYTKDKDVSYSNSNWMAGPGNDLRYTTNIGTQGANLQKVFDIGDHRVIVGGQWDRIEIDNRSNQGAPYNPDSRYDSYGAFAEGRLSLLDKKLLLSGGLRYDYFENDILQTAGIDGIPKSKTFNHVTARGGVVYKLTDALGLKGSVGTAFRAPAPLELAADYTLFGTHTVGNPSLKPEQSTSFDAGVDYLKGFFKGSASFFHTDFRDKIANYFDMTRLVSTYKNVDGATIEGIELGSSYDIGAAMGFKIVIEPFTNITYKTTYTQKNEGQQDTTLVYTPKWTGAFGVRLGQEKWDGRIIANYLGWEKVTDWDPTSATYGNIIHKAGFTVLSLGAHYRPVKSIELMLSVENLLDRRYEYVLGYPMPGRAFIGGMKWLF